MMFIRISLIVKVKLRRGLAPTQHQPISLEASEFSWQMFLVCDSFDDLKGASIKSASAPSGTLMASPPLVNPLSQAMTGA